MNLIDFHVTKIIEETEDKVYKLYGMSDEKLEKEKSDEWWYGFLCGNGIKQVYEYWDDGGTRVDKNVFNLDVGQKPYYVGYVGQH